MNLDNPVEYNQNAFGETPLNLQPDVQRYFDQLPSFLQENIMQSGIEIQSVSHLEQIANNMLEENSDNSFR